MKWDVVNIEGNKVRTIDLPDDIYGLEMNEAVLHTVVKAYLANKRQGTAATKTRAFVSGGSKKPFRQKGTGNARQGHGRSPLYPGGAVSHGPQPRDHRQNINKKMKQLALKVALSDKCRHKKLIVVDDFSIAKYSTKDIVKTLSAVKASNTALMLDERKDNFLYRSARNINGAVAASPLEINTENVLRHESLIVSETALNVLAQRLGGN
ncbi:MAG: 50S ribosomal protein L4 [Bdellovibrionota bacterium]